ncbi:MAG TPA: small multi-drug export protein [Tissierellia bacterium]|nr:small multi-drug export protein [Tissierellia bacterium]
MKHYLITLLLAMAPISEVRGAIPYAMANGIPRPLDFLLPVLGNIFIIPWLLFLLEPFFRWLSRRRSLKKLNQWVIKYQRRTVEKVNNHRRAILLALFLFVAIPLPSTGAYSGALAAVVLRIPKRQAFPVLALGVLAAGLIVYLASLGVIHLL